jgi:hypothetical protein
MILCIMYYGLKYTNQSAICISCEYMSWGKFTNDFLNKIAGFDYFDFLLGKIIETYYSVRYYRGLFANTHCDLNIIDLYKDPNTHPNIIENLQKKCISTIYHNFPCSIEKPSIYLTDFINFSVKLKNENVREKMKT